MRGFAELPRTATHDLLPTAGVQRPGHLLSEATQRAR
jgi:hypothetical protein